MVRAKVPGGAKLCSGSNRAAGPAYNAGYRQRFKSSAPPFVPLSGTADAPAAIVTALCALRSVPTGTLTSAQFVKNATGLAADANDRIIYETDTGRLFYDSNGNAAGGAVQFATLAAGLALTNADFFVV